MTTVLVPGTPEANLVSFLVQAALAKDPMRFFAGVKWNEEQRMTLIRIGDELLVSDEVTSPVTSADMPPELMTVGEAAPIFGQDPRTVRRKARDGKIPGAHKRNGDWQLPKSAVLAMARKGVGE